MLQTLTGLDNVPLIFTAALQMGHGPGQFRKQFLFFFFIFHEKISSVDLGASAQTKGGYLLWDTRCLKDPLDTTS